MKRILIVDDHALFRSGLEGLFNSQPDFTVVGEAGNIKEAIQKAQELQPDLVIMDLGLPDGSGLEAMDKILLKVPHTKIVFLTIYDEDQTAFAAIRHGAKGFLLKTSLQQNCCLLCEGLSVASWQSRVRCSAAFWWKYCAW